MSDGKRPKPSTSKKPSFWKTLPGILTAAAGFTTAIAGLIVALNQAGLLKRSVPVPPAATSAELPVSSSTDSTAADASTPGTGLSAVADDVAYTILSGQRRQFSSSEYLIVLEIGVTARANSMNFEDDMFRLSIDGLRYPPHTNLSNQWVQENSDWKERVEFVVPNDARSLSLQVGRAGTDRVSTIPLPLDVVSRW